LSLRARSIDAQTNFFDPGESMEPRLWIIDHDVADFRARAGHEMTTPAGRPASPTLEKFVGNRGASDDGLSNYRVPSRLRAAVMPAIIAQGNSTAE